MMTEDARPGENDFLRLLELRGGVSCFYYAGLKGCLMLPRIYFSEISCDRITFLYSSLSYGRSHSPTPKCARSAFWYRIGATMLLKFKMSASSSAIFLR